MKGKKILAVVLTAVLLISANAVFAYGASSQMAQNMVKNAAGASYEVPTGHGDGLCECKTACHGTCPYSPSVVLHGIGQSVVRTVGEDGNYVVDENGEYVNAWPISVDATSLIKTLALPLVKSVLFQRDFVSDALSSAATDIFKSNMCGPDGMPLADIDVVKYPTSVAECDDDGKQYIYKTIPLAGYSDIAGEDHLYFFSYNSFGNALSIAAELVEYIENVKRETGHDKVNLIPISLGGTIMNTLMEVHMDEVADSIDKVVYIVPASDGSAIVSDLFKGKLSVDDESMYSTLWPSLVEGYAGYLINIALRLLRHDTVMSILDTLLNTLVDKVLVNCTNMWALLMSEDYPAMREKHLSDDAHAEIRRQTDIYYNAQINRDANITELIDDYGVEFFDVVDYDFPLYAIVPCYTDYNADGVIHIGSTSLGCYSVPTGQTLPEGYIPENPVCTDPTHNHISPYNNVDASVGLLPDSTWYFHNQSHERTGKNTEIMELAIEILTNDNMTSVYSNPNFPQFMDGKTSRDLRNMIAEAEGFAVPDTVSQADRDRLSAAITEAKRIMDDHTTSAQEYNSAITELRACLVAVGLYQPEEEETWWEKTLYNVCKKLSDTLYKTRGNRGFFELPKIG